MNFSIEEGIQILERTPKILKVLLIGLNTERINFQKRPDAFSALNVIAHLISGEQTDWIPRMKIMLKESGSKEFVPFDPEDIDRSKDFNELLTEFEQLRLDNIAILKKSINEEDLNKTGIHPTFGEVTLQQHLATWVVHDLNHIFQIIESLALQYKEEVGPWIEFLKILRL